MASLRVRDGHLGVFTVDLHALGIVVQFTSHFGDRLLLGMGIIALARVAVGIKAGRVRSKFRILAILPAANQGPPNILLLVLDTVRAMSLSAYGHARKTTPNMDANTIDDPRPPFDTALSEPTYPDPLPTRGAGHGIVRPQWTRPYDHLIADPHEDSDAETGTKLKHSIGPVVMRPGFQPIAAPGALKH
jgi:hypothetical protein